MHNTLSIISKMESVYSMDDKGNWTGIRPITSQPGELKRCPNCRAPIKNVKRYGRITKKCVLDTQNKKFLQRYGHQLKVIRADFEKTIGNLEKNRGKVLEELKKPDVKQIVIINDKEDYYKERDEMINRTAPHVVPLRKYEMLEKYYSIPAYYQKLWCKHVSGLLSNYNKIAIIISNSTNPPYKLAYEAAVASL